MDDGIVTSVGQVQQTQPDLNVPVTPISTPVEAPIVQAPIVESPQVDVPVEIPQQNPLKRNDTVPISVYLSEKEKRKKAEQQLTLLYETSEKESIRKQWLADGYDEKFAEAMALIQCDLALQKRKSKSDMLEDEIMSLAKSDSFYSDAAAYKLDIANLMETKGLSAEDAYMVVRGRSRTREVREDVEQLTLVNRRQDPIVQNEPTSMTSGAPRNPYPLDANDNKALEMLQKSQPWASWTAEKYYNVVVKDR